MKNNIDSLLVDMIDLGIADHRVNITMYTKDYTGKYKLYAKIIFPDLDKHEEEISRMDVIKDLNQNNPGIETGPGYFSRSINIHDAVRRFREVFSTESAICGIREESVLYYIFKNMFPDMGPIGKLELNIDSKKYILSYNNILRTFTTEIS